MWWPHSDDFREQMMLDRLAAQAIGGGLGALALFALVVWVCVHG